MVNPNTYRQSSYTSHPSIYSPTCRLHMRLTVYARKFFLFFFFFFFSSCGVRRFMLQPPPPPRLARNGWVKGSTCVRCKVGSAALEPLFCNRIIMLAVIVLLGWFSSALCQGNLYLLLAMTQPFSSYRAAFLLTN